MEEGGTAITGGGPRLHESNRRTPGHSTVAAAGGRGLPKGLVLVAGIHAREVAMEVRRRRGGRPPSAGRVAVRRRHHEGTGRGRHRRNGGTGWGRRRWESERRCSRRWGLEKGHRRRWEIGAEVPLLCLKSR